MGEQLPWPLPDVSVAPPVTSLEPTVDGCRPQAGVFTLVAFGVTPSLEQRDVWCVEAVWELSADFPRVLVVDGAVLTMEGQERAVEIASTMVRPGERLRLRGPKVCWLPEVVEAVRELEGGVTLPQWLRDRYGWAEREAVYNTVAFRESGGESALPVLECMVGKSPDLLALVPCAWRVDASGWSVEERGWAAYRHSRTHAYGSVATVLADIARKRAIVGECEADLRVRGDGALYGRVDRVSWRVLTVLAREFVGQPGWRMEWAA